MPKNSKKLGKGIPKKESKVEFRPKSINETKLEGTNLMKIYVSVKRTTISVK